MYEIRVLENEEFDKLPYKHATTALGMADAKAGVAYVRKTGVAGLDANTIRHEFDELLQSVSPHEEDGIRYKSGGSLGKWLAPVLGVALAPFTGGLTAALAAGTLAAGTGAHSRSVKPEKYGENTFGRGLLDFGLGAASGYGGHSLGTGFIGGFKGAAGQGLGSQLYQGARGALGLPTTTAATKGAGALAGKPASGLGARFTQAATQPTGTQLAAQAGTRGVTTTALSQAGSKAVSKASTGLFAKAGDYLKSGAKNLAGNALVSSLQPTQARPTVGIGGSGAAPGNALSLFGTQPRKATQGTFTAPYGQEDVQKGLDKINQQYQKQYQSIFDTFRGQTVEGNSAFANQLAQAKRGLGLTTEDFYSGVNKANEDAYTKFRYTGVKNTNNLSDSQMREYIRLAQQPDSVIRGRFPGMTPKAFRDIFTGLESFA